MEVEKRIKAHNLGRVDSIFDVSLRLKIRSRIKTHLFISFNRPAQFLIGFGWIHYCRKENFLIFFRRKVSLMLRNNIIHILLRR